MADLKLIDTLELGNDNELAHKYEIYGADESTRNMPLSLHDRARAANGSSRMASCNLQRRMKTGSDRRYDGLRLWRQHAGFARSASGSQRALRTASPRKPLIVAAESIPQGGF